MLDGRRDKLAAIVGPDIGWRASAVVAGFNGGPPTSVVQNAASAHIRGFELEATAIPARGLTLAATVAHVDAEYRSFRDGLGNDFSSQKFQNQPRWTYSLSAGYTAACPIGQAHAKVDWYWRSSADLFPNGAAAARYRTAGSYGLLNGRLSQEIGDAGIEVAVWGKNLTNKRYRNTAFDLSDSWEP